MSRRSLVLGVDGSGRKTTAIVADDHGNVLAQRQGGVSDPHRAGFDGAAKTLYQLISRSCEDARCAPDELLSVVLGLFGLQSQADGVRIAEAVNKIFVKVGLSELPLRIETEGRIALEGAFDGKPGILLTVGADSFVIGKTEKGAILTVGGWGRALGDEGSGFFLGREALMLVAQHTDRRTNAGTLPEVLRKKFQWQSRAEILAALYQQKFDLASLAPIVLETAAGNDQVAQRIVQKSATLLAEQVRVVAMQMGILHKVGLVMMGSLLEHDSVYANAVQLKILKLLPQVEVRSPLHSPTDGAVRLALERQPRK